MNRVRLPSIVILMMLLPVCLLSNAASAERLLDTYIARLSSRDHYNSRGQKLRTVAGVIRQDRANYHKFGLRDPADEYDLVFSSTRARELLEKRLARGYCNASARRAILNSTPLIRVEIYQTYVRVAVID